MTSSTKNIVDGFLFPTIDTIVETPDYESIADIHLELNSNVALVQSNLRCDTLVLLFLTVLPVIYATLSTIEFVPPVSPGPEPNIPADATRTAIVDLWCHHMEATKVFTEYKNTDKALRQLLLASTEELYVISLYYKYIVYGKTTTRPLLDHLYTIYAKMSTSALHDNDMRLRDPFDNNQPFETLINQVENAVDYASTRDTPYTPAQIVTIYL